MASEAFVIVCTKAPDGSSTQLSPPCPEGWIASTVSTTDFLMQGVAERNAQEWAQAQWFTGVTSLLMIIGYFSGLAINRMGLFTDSK